MIIKNANPATEKPENDCFIPQSPGNLTQTKPDIYEVKDLANDDDSEAIKQVASLESSTQVKVVGKDGEKIDQQSDEAVWENFSELNDTDEIEENADNGSDDDFDAFERDVDDNLNGVKNIETNSF